MDRERVEFVFGASGAAAALGELDDLEERGRLLSGAFEDDEPDAVLSALREIVANQILDDDPPEVWETVRRLGHGGLDRDAVFRQITVALAPRVQELIVSETPFDRDAYVVALGQLPLPTAREVSDVWLDVVRDGTSDADAATEATLVGSAGRGTRSCTRAWKGCSTTSSRDR